MTGVQTCALPILTNMPELGNASFVTMPSYTANVATLQEAAKGAGFFSLNPDPDGVLRRAPLVIRLHGKLYSSLALEAVRIYYSLNTISIQAKQLGQGKAISGIYLGAKKLVSTDGEGRVIIPYRGASNSYRYISARDVLNKNFSAKLFVNTIVLVGTTAGGLLDFRAVPMQSVYPGVEVHANLISGLLDNKFPVEPAWTKWANLVLLIMFGLILTVWLPCLHVLRQALVSISIILLFVAFNLWMWMSQGLVLAMAIPMLLMIMLATLNLAYGLFTQEIGRAHV